MSGAQFATREYEQRRAGRTPSVAPSGPALTVGHVEDPAEREADRVADTVIARLQPAGAGPEQPHAIRRAPAPGAAAEVGFAGGDVSPELSAEIAAARSGGAQLEAGVRGRMEEAFGASLGGVRVHTGPAAAGLNRRVSARAFTVGQDIFFGTGEYRPDTTEGERTLAHEIAHTRQHGGVHRLHRLWDFSKPVDYTKLTRTAPVTSGQPVFFLTDNTGDQIAVKAEGGPVGVSILSEALHNRAGGAKSVKHVKVADKGALIAALKDTTKWDAPSVTKLGKSKRAATGLEGNSYAYLRQRVGDQQAAAMSDYEVGEWMIRDGLDSYLGGLNWMAMSMATGMTAQQASRAEDKNEQGVGVKEETKFRRILKNRKHNIALGQVTAIDLFMGNGDRVVSGNVGNWFYQDMGGVMTVIDHVDRNVEDMTEDYLQGKGAVHADLERLAKGKLTQTAAWVLDSMATGIESDLKGDDPTFRAWLDSNDGMYREFIEEGLEEGLRQGRERLTKIFTATRFRGKRSDRKVKKGLKAVAHSARQTDDDQAVDPNAYYEMLKQRAQWLKKH